jgi:hypothetical protein
MTLNFTYENPRRAASAQGQDTAMQCRPKRQKVFSFGFIA